MNAFEKLDALGASVEATKVIDITVGDKTEKVTLRRLSFEESQNLTSTIMVVDDEGNIKPNVDKFKERSALLIALSVVGEDGSQMTAEQAKKLNAKIGNQIVKAANDFNGFNDKAVESAAKNSSATASTATS